MYLRSQHTSTGIRGYIYVFVCQCLVSCSVYLYMTRTAINIHRPHPPQCPRSQVAHTVRLEEMFLNPMKDKDVLNANFKSSVNYLQIYGFVKLTKYSLRFNLFHVCMYLHMYIYIYGTLYCSVNVSMVLGIQCLILSRQCFGRRRTVSYICLCVQLCIIQQTIHLCTLRAGSCKHIEN